MNALPTDDAWIKCFERVPDPPEFDNLCQLRDMLVSNGFTSPSTLLGASEAMLLHLSGAGDLVPAVSTFAVRVLRHLETSDARSRVERTSPVGSMSPQCALLSMHASVAAPRRTSSSSALPASGFPQCISYTSRSLALREMYIHITARRAPFLADSTVYPAILWICKVCSIWSLFLFQGVHWLEQPVYLTNATRHSINIVWYSTRLNCSK